MTRKTSLNKTKDIINADCVRFYNIFKYLTITRTDEKSSNDDFIVSFDRVKNVFLKNTITTFQDCEANEPLPMHHQSQLNPELWTLNYMH